MCIRDRETVEFARKMKFTRLGIAFCDGLRKESATLHSILEKNGFQVASVVCCVGGRPKEEIGIQDPQKIHPGGYESMCNPIAQALVLNAQKTEFNILIGLCVGHDSLFLRYADAPCTVLIVKDRVLGHNPIAALHVSNSYYSHIVPSS